MSVKNPAVKLKGGHALKDTKGDKIFFVINALFLGLLALIILYPLYFIVIASFSDPDAVLGGQVVFAPVNVTFEGYEKVFQRQDIWTGYWNTLWYTVVTVILALAVTIPAGWGLSRKTTPGKKFWMLYFIIPMFFGGGLMGVGYEKALLMQTDGNLAVSELIATYVYKRGLTGVPDQAYATAIGLFNSVINVVLLIIANTTSKRFSEKSLW